MAPIFIGVAPINRGSFHNYVENLSLLSKISAKLDKKPP
jgi:hypothetical protein